MCTGLSIPLEITVLLSELGIKCAASERPVKFREDCAAGVTASELQNTMSWVDCRIEIIKRLLKLYRNLIIQCPAVHWRVACIRNVSISLGIYPGSGFTMNMQHSTQLKKQLDFISLVNPVIILLFRAFIRKTLSVQPRKPGISG